MQSLLLILLANLVSFAIAFAAGVVLLEILARPWRRSAGLHWTERARLAHTPSQALLLLGLPLALFLGAMLEAIVQGVAHKPTLTTAAFVANSIATMAGALAVRYLWLRELWGPRVTVRTWLAGFFIIGLAIWPGLFAALILAIAMPDHLNLRAVIIFCAAVLAVAFCALGGELKLLRWLRILKPAPPALTATVQQLAELMHVSGTVRVFVLEWAHVNALAWERNRAVGFSRAMLNVMTDSEVRAVAAHELAHLLEPRWVRRIRTAYTFAYLPLVPLAKYGGPFGALAAIVLGATILMAYARFSHRFEQSADRAESDAIADPGAYARSMITLHQANASPAVMPGKQTHPHLYDRLLAGGIQPDFPRPQPPSGAKSIVAIAITTLAVMLLVIVMLAVIMVGLHLAGYDLTMDAP